jgi:hypothetical protein
MKRHDSVRRFVVAEAFDKVRQQPGGGSLVDEYYTGKYRLPDNEEEDQKKALAKKALEKKEKPIVTVVPPAESTEVQTKSFLRSVSTEVLDQGFLQAMGLILGEPSSLLAHSVSHGALLQGVTNSLETILDDPHMSQAHSTSHQVLDAAIVSISAILEAERKRVLGLGPEQQQQQQQQQQEDVGHPNYSEENLLRLLHRAQSMISKHQAARGRCGGGSHTQGWKKHGSSKSSKNKNKDRVIFRKGANIDRLDRASSSYEQLAASYNALQLPPFGPNLGPNLSRYKASCQGDYKGKALIDTHGTGIGSALDTLPANHPASKANTIRTPVKGSGAGDGDGDGDGGPASKQRPLPAWPSPALKEAADTWVQKQRGHVEDIYTRKARSGCAADKDNKYNKKTHDRTPLENEALDVYNKALSALVARLDLVIAIAHCGECRSHMTLKHKEDKYSLLAHSILSKLAAQCLEWRIPFRVGAVALPRRASLSHQTKQAFNSMKGGVAAAAAYAQSQPISADSINSNNNNNNNNNNNDNGSGNGKEGKPQPSEAGAEDEKDAAGMVELLLKQCCTHVPVGSFEVFIACRDEKGTYHCVRLFSKLDTLKFPNVAVLKRKLHDAVVNLSGGAGIPQQLAVIPPTATAATAATAAAAAAAALNESPSPSPQQQQQQQLTVPVCSYPEVCQRGCHVNNVDSYSLEELRTAEEISDLCGAKLSVFEPSELELGLGGGTTTPSEIAWVADFSLESKQHLFSVGDVVDVRQVAPLSLSPRRKRSRKQRQQLQHMSYGDTDTRPPSTYVRKSHFDLEVLHVRPTAYNAGGAYNYNSSSSRGNSKNGDNGLGNRPASPTSRQPPTVSQALLDIMTTPHRRASGEDRPASPLAGVSSVAHVYSPVRTAAYLRRTGGSMTPNTPSGSSSSHRHHHLDLFGLGLDTRVPFAVGAQPSALLTRSAMPFPVEAGGAIIGAVEHHDPFKVSRNIQRGATSNANAAAAAAAAVDDDSSREERELWYVFCSTFFLLFLFMVLCLFCPPIVAFLHSLT